MQALSDIDAVDFEAIRRASVGSVVSALQHYGHAYLLVVEAATRGAPPRIRGVFSAAQVERQLGVPLNSVEVAATFAEIATALRELTRRCRRITFGYENIGSSPLEL
jgi:hypothetical protein